MVISVVLRASKYIYKKFCQQYKNYKSIIKWIEDRFSKPKIKKIKRHLYIIENKSLSAQNIEKIKRKSPWIRRKSF